jgi:transcriptional regulator with XRE-family HTH domain
MARLIADYETTRFLEQLSKQLHSMKESSGLSVRGLAKKMNSSKSLLWRILNEARNTSVTTLLRFAKVCGYEMSITFEKKKEE